MPYDMALASLLDSMMFEKTIKAVATNIGDMNKAVGGWDFTSSP
jgi:HAMP domain-containing protein